MQCNFNLFLNKILPLDVFLQQCVCVYGHSDMFAWDEHEGLYCNYSCRMIVTKIGFSVINDHERAALVCPSEIKNPKL